MNSLPILQPSAIRPDGKRAAIVTMDVKGRFITARRIVFALLMAVYAGVSLVHVGGHPAVHLDVENRRFYLFGGTFNAQDFWMVLLLATTALFGLLFVTAWRGRAWCGWACPQTVFLEGLFRPIERLTEGSRAQRAKRKGSPLTFTRLMRTTVKHVLFIFVAAAVAHVALALFLSLEDLVGMVTEGPVAHPVAFGWAAAVTALLYFNFAWFREQFCVVLCPYGRMQSVLHDEDSIVVAYDAGRGEPRGARRKMSAQPTGHCVDCRKCVHVCPTGIDIRNGLQMECLSCAQCIDVCDEVMAKIGSPKGLIRYASLNELAGRARRTSRPRLWLYAGLFAVCGAGFIGSVFARTPFEANVLRPPGVPWVLEGGSVRNQVEIHLVNKNAAAATFRIRAESVASARIEIGQRELELASLAHVRIPVVVVLPRVHVTPATVVRLHIEDRGTGNVRNPEFRVLAPGVR